MKVLYDTSVLLAALLVEHANHSLAFPQLELARRGMVQGCLSTHSLAELYSVMTRLPLPLRVVPDEAEAAIMDLLDYLEPSPLLVAEYQQAIRQMVTLRLVGGVIFDAIIAQAALKAGVDQILTFNPKDFTRLGERVALLVQVPS